MNFIGDVGEQYDCLLRLISKMPQDDIIFLGDLVDRGPKSKEVVELVRSKYRCVMANHEHMMIDFVCGYGWYDPGLWETNGGRATLASYGFEPFGKRPGPDSPEFARMENDVLWMQSNPLYIETEHVFASHAPWCYRFELDEVTKIFKASNHFEPYISDDSLLWNRSEPKPRRFKDKDGLTAEPFGKLKLQVYGHNAGKEVVWFDDENEKGFAVCIDTSWGKKLTGLHVDDEKGTTTVYQEAY